MESLAESVYNCKWVNNPSHRIKTGLLMIMQRSQRRHVFIAGELVHVNMKNFTEVNSKIILFG